MTCAPDTCSSRLCCGVATIATQQALCSGVATVVTREFGNILNIFYRQALYCGVAIVATRQALCCGVATVATQLSVVVSQPLRHDRLSVGVSQPLRRGQYIAYVVQARSLLWYRNRCDTALCCGVATIATRQALYCGVATIATRQALYCGVATIAARQALSFGSLLPSRGSEVHKTELVGSQVSLKHRKFTQSLQGHKPCLDYDKVTHSTPAQGIKCQWIGTDDHF
ncbi:hypothetical protein B0H19DRAFT_1067408 [Mycena capillaripes]|nr:hypothetical protein B0H19DRAFT_1067408 [Mycena capillaripes]